MDQTIPRNKLVCEYFNEAEWAIGCKYQKWRKNIMINMIEYGLYLDIVMQRDWIQLSYRGAWAH